MCKFEHLRGEVVADFIEVLGFDLALLVFGQKLERVVQSAESFPGREE